MIANLYLHPDAFAYNGIDSRETVRDKLMALAGDMKEVVYNNNKENIFKVTNSFANTPVFKGVSVVDFVVSELSYEERGVFFSMLANTANGLDEISIEKLKEICKYSEQETEVNSLVILNIPKVLDKDNDENQEEQKKKPTIIKDYITFDVYHIVYDSHSWLHLRRQILGNHPENPESFILECRKYFPNLIFHDNCIDSLDDGEWKYLEMVPRRIVYYLSCLNDKFEDTRKKLGCTNPNDILANFSGMFGFDRPGSLQQNPDKKPAITFSFKSEVDGNLHSILCEPHLKIDQVDANRRVGNINTKHFNPRIYFCYTSPEISNGRILVGSIGKHI